MPEGTRELDESKYVAFISYRQVPPDSLLARHLHRALESYRVPRSLVKQGIPRRIGRVFRDREELAASPSLGESIHDALRNSRFLLVVCSRQTPKSKWIEKEVLDFIAMGRKDRILTILVEGEPADSLPAPLLDPVPETAALADQSEPLAADLRATSLRKAVRKLRTEKLRVIAPMIGRSFDELRQRQRERTMARLITGSVVSALAAAVFALLTVFAFYQKGRAERGQMISLEQSLSARALREKSLLMNDERAALLAKQAYLFSKRHTGARMDQIDLALREILESPDFSVALDGSDSGNLAVAFSPLDGTLVGAGADGVFRIWDLNHPDESAKTINSMTGPVRWMSIGAHDGRIVAVTVDDELVSWPIGQSDPDTDDMQVVALPHGRVTAASFSPEGGAFVTSHVDGFFVVWQIHEGKLTSREYEFRGSESTVNAIALDPNGATFVVTGDEAGAIKVWHLDSTPIRAQEIARHDTAVSSIAVSPDGRFIASGSELAFPDGVLGALFDASAEDADIQLARAKVFLWDREVSRMEAVIADGVAGTISSLVFNPSSDVLAYGDIGNGNVLMYDVYARTSQSVLPPPLESGEFSIAFDMNTRLLAAVTDREASIRLWDLSRPTGAPVELRGHGEAVVSMAFSPAGQTLISAGGGDGTVGVWSFDKPFPALKSHSVLGPFPGSVSSVAYGPDEGTFAAGTGAAAIEPDPDNSVRLWSGSNQERPLRLTGYGSPVSTVAISPDGRFLASSAEDDKEIRIWEIAEHGKSSRVISTYPYYVSALAFRPNSDLLAWADNRGTVHLVDINTSNGSTLSEHQKAITSIAFDPDGDVMAAAYEDASVLTWQLRSPERPFRVLRGHGGQVHDLAISSELILASASSDGTVRLWDLNSESRSPRILEGRWTIAYAVAFEPDGRWLAVGSSDSVIRLYPLTDVLADKACQLVCRNLSREEWYDFVGDTMNYECTCPDLPPGSNTGLSQCSELD